MLFLLEQQILKIHTPVIVTIIGAVDGAGPRASPRL